MKKIVFLLILVSCCFVANKSIFADDEWVRFDNCYLSNNVTIDDNRIASVKVKYTGREGYYTIYEYRFDFKNRLTIVDRIREYRNDGELVGQMMPEFVEWHSIEAPLEKAIADKLISNSKQI